MPARSLQVGETEIQTFWTGYKLSKDFLRRQLQYQMFVQSSAAHDSIWQNYISFADSRLRRTGLATPRFTPLRAYDMTLQVLQQRNFMWGKVDLANQGAERCHNRQKLRSCSMERLPPNVSETQVPTTLLHRCEYTAIGLQKSIRDKKRQNIKMSTATGFEPVLPKEIDFYYGWFSNDADVL